VRSVSLFYYPGPCGPADAPTVFLPGSHHYALDREGFGQGEERLHTHMVGPKSGEEWAAAIGRNDRSSLTNAQVDARRADGIPLLGVPVRPPH